MLSRYDDSKVSSTTLEAVTSGSNVFNSYILTYIHRPLWRRLVRGLLSTYYIYLLEF